MKTCTRCGESKDESEFRMQNKHLGKTSPWCKMCFSSYERAKWAGDADFRTKGVIQRKARYARNSQYVWGYLLDHPCACGEADPVVLEFDHNDPKLKRMSVSALVQNAGNINDLQKEIEKCTVRCANCHRRRTAAQLGWYKHIK